MRENKLRKAVSVALAPVGAALIATSMASAQTGTFTNTFDNSSSIVLVRDYNPPPESFVFDYGGSGPTAHHSVAWTGAENDGGPAGSGSVQLSWTFNGPSSGGATAAFTTDVFPYATGTQPGAMVTDISFNLMVDPSSTQDKYGGYGFFQVFTRDESYNVVSTPFSEELGNPSYGGPSTSDAGTWESINIPFSTPVPVRGITLQDYDDGSTTGRDIVGPETIYIDNMSITYEVPEPASLGLLGVSLPALLMRRRSKAKLG